MKAEHKENRGYSRSTERQQHKLLLVSYSTEIDDSPLLTSLNGKEIHVTGKATSLVEALGHLTPEGIDIVLLGSEFSEEVLALFSYDARRRGFDGLMLQVISAAGYLSKYGLQHSSTTAEPTNFILERAPSDTLTSAETDKSCRLPTFTVQQQAVLIRVSNGWTNKQIAFDLKCSESSVKALIQTLFKKLGVRKRAQIVRMAFEGGGLHVTPMHPDRRYLSAGR